MVLLAIKLASGLLPCHGQMVKISQFPTVIGEVIEDYVETRLCPLAIACPRHRKWCVLTVDRRSHIVVVHVNAAVWSGFFST
jgi:hypothetical protein